MWSPAGRTETTPPGPIFRKLAYSIQTKTIPESNNAFSGISQRDGSNVAMFRIGSMCDAELSNSGESVQRLWYLRYWRKSPLLYERQLLLCLHKKKLNACTTPAFTCGNDKRRSCSKAWVSFRRDAETRSPRAPSMKYTSQTNHSNLKKLAALNSKTTIQQ